MAAVINTPFAHVVALVRALGPVEHATRDQVCAVTGLGVTTVRTICRNLVDWKIASEWPKQPRESGRYPYPLSLNKDRGIAIGLVLTSERVIATTFDAALRFESQSSLEVRSRDHSPTKYQERVLQVVAQENLKHRAKKVLGIGVCASRDPHRATTKHRRGSSLDLTPLVDALRESTEAPVVQMSPAQALAEARLWQLPSLRTANFVAVMLGDRVDVAMSLDGHVHEGHSEEMGPIDHSMLVFHGRPCVCGLDGCVAAYLSPGGMLETLRADHPSDPLATSAQSLHDIAVAASVGSPVARNVIDQIGLELTVALDPLLSVVGADVLVIGGPAALELGSDLVDSTNRHVHERAAVSGRRAAVAELA